MNPICLNSFRIKSVQRSVYQRCKLITYSRSPFFYRDFGRVRDFLLSPWFCFTAVKISVLCVISALERSLVYTRNPCFDRETARCRCKIQYLSKFTAASRGSPCDSTALVWHLSDTIHISSYIRASKKQANDFCGVSLTFLTIDGWCRLMSNVIRDTWHFLLLTVPKSSVDSRLFDSATSILPGQDRLFVSTGSEFVEDLSINTFLPTDSLSPAVYTGDYSRRNNNGGFCTTPRCLGPAVTSQYEMLIVA